MNRRQFIGIAGAAGVLSASGFPMPHLAKAAASDAPKSFRDPLSGHLVRRLSPNPGSHVLYFTDNAFTADGRYMVYDSARGCDVVDLQTFEAAPLIEGPYECMMVSRTKNIAYVYHKDAKGGGKDATGLNYYAVSIPDGKVTQIAENMNGTLFQSNADETLMLGRWQEREYELQPGPKVAGTDGGYNAIGPDGKPMSFADAKMYRMAERLKQNIPMEIFTIDLKTGKRNTVLRDDRNWLNHVVFSPTDPGQIMYCHEGPWQMVDRIWTVRADGSAKTNVHHRMMEMEIAGHEFISADGKAIWYDIQLPQGEAFWLASYDMTTGERIWRQMERNEWSLHFNTTRDGRLIGGDGAGPDLDSHAPDGKYIYIYEEELAQDKGTLRSGKDSLIRAGKLKSKKVVDLSTHDYRTEPNVQFSADSKWLTFKSNMHGEIHVYAVETEKSA